MWVVFDVTDSSAVYCVRHFSWCYQTWNLNVMSMPLTVQTLLVIFFKHFGYLVHEISDSGSVVLRETDKIPPDIIHEVIFNLPKCDVLLNNYVCNFNQRMARMC